MTTPNTGENSRSETGSGTLTGVQYDNPLLTAFDGPFGLPPFDVMASSHFSPAFDAAFEASRDEIESIAAEPAQPTFENTIVALEDSGRLLDKVSAVFWNLVSADSSDELKELERQLAPRMAAHHSIIMSNAKLFNRIKAVFDKKETLGLSDEQARLLERTHRNFVRAGAHLAADDKARLGQILQRSASLATQFSQNVLADEAAFELELQDEDDLAGMPAFLRDAAATAAAERGSRGSHVVTLSRSLIEPFLIYSERRDLREKAYEAWVARGGNGGVTDNRAIISEILQLRAERARLLGYDTFADYKLDNTMAKTPDRVEELLGRVWQPAVLRALEEEADLEKSAVEEGLNIDLAAWDWWHFSEKVRAQKFNLSEADIKPYFALDQMIAAAFFTAERLFGLRFQERTELALYHEDARAWDVVDANDAHVGLFIGDYFARSSKRSGAWMTSFRNQEKLAGNIRPIILNVCNFAKGRTGQPALLSLGDVRTLFHEFGHGLHGLMSDVTYPSMSGTSVETDFVELPSQLYEHWAMTDEILEKFARHYDSGEAIPEALIAKVRAAETFNQGFATVEYLASALVDMAYHRAGDAIEIDPLEFEAQTLLKLGMPKAIGMRHRSSHFLHVFAGDGYAAGYYSYMWSEVLDADAFEAFREVGNVFDADTAQRLKTYIYSSGAKRPGKDAYLAFRGQMPEIDGLLRDRGLADS